MPPTLLGMFWFCSSSQRLSTAEGLVKPGSSVYRPLKAKTLDSCFSRNDEQKID